MELDSADLKNEVIASVNGDARLVSRITSIGITPGCKITIIKNETLIALYYNQLFWV